MSRLRKHDRWALATATLLAVVTVLIGLTFLDYGVTVDEEHSASNGMYFLEWYDSAFRDNTINTKGNQYLYGSFFNAISVFLAVRSPFGLYETGHLVIAITGLIGIFFCSRLGKLLAGSMAGFFSALLLALTPAFYGHLFINPKDVPFAVMFLIAIYYLTRAFEELPRLSGRTVVVLGVVIGLTLGIRIGALLLFGYCAVLAGIWLIAQKRVWNDLRAASLSFVKVGVIAWIVMVVWWPYAQLSPILNPLRAFRRNSNFSDWQGTSLYQGEFILSSELPWHYLPVSFLITLPEFYAIIALFAIVAMGMALVMAKRAGQPPKSATNAEFRGRLLFVAFAMLFPLVIAIVMRPILYDGNRHFLFVIPPLAVLAGVTLSWLFSDALPQPLKIVMASMLLLAGAATALDMTRLHPYQYLFYNRSSGGLQAALGRYETDYWGASHKEGIDWLARNYRRGAPAGSIRVANTAARFQTSYYLDADGPETRRFTPVAKDDSPHVVLSITRWNAHLKRRGRVLHVVRRMGVPLLYVVETRDPAAAVARE